VTIRDVFKRVSSMGYRVGVDIGGSFTDFSAISEETGEVKTLKVFSRPD